MTHTNEGITTREVKQQDTHLSRGNSPQQQEGKAGVEDDTRVTREVRANYNTFM